MWMCTFSFPNNIARAEYFRVPFETNPQVDARKIGSKAIRGEERVLCFKAVEL